MVQINEVVPSRFRAGDQVAINGFGFAPTYVENAVAVDGIPATLDSQSATQLLITIPGGIPEDNYVPIIAFRSDTLENDTALGFSKGALADLRGGITRPPGQVPGAEERLDPSRVEDTPQAQDYERMVSAIDYLLHHVLATKGDVFASDGAGLVPQPVGAAGQRLGANPATGTGMTYGAITRAQTLSWGGRKAIADVALGSLAANGWWGDVATVIGRHLAPLTGTAYRLALVFRGTAGDTLDQVTVLRSGVLVWNSGTGLGITPGNVIATPISIAVTGGTHHLEVQAKKLGANGDGYINAIMGVR